MLSSEKASMPQKKDTNSSNSKQSRQIPLSNYKTIIQRVRMYPQSFSPADAMSLQKTIGNQAVGRLMMENGLINDNPKPIQREALPKEPDILQGKFVTIQRKEEKIENEEPLQTKKENKTGLPDNLKAGVEKLSGFSMDDVRVHYNSDKPSQIGALAYTQGTDINVAPGQEKHLPHEVWHVVQQAQGRVQPIKRIKEISVNDDIGLENEANEMAYHIENPIQRKIHKEINQKSKPLPIQMLPAPVKSLLDNIVRSDPHLFGMKYAVTAISDWLTHNNLIHRLGGSLAARLQGGTRRPADIDVEVKNGSDLLNAYNLICRMNGNVTIEGNTARCQVLNGVYQQNLYADVNIRFTAPNSTHIDVSVDIVNENNSLFNQHLISPERRGVRPTSGDLVSKGELIMNYLDRILNKRGTAKIKQDHIQIISILRSAGFNPNNQNHRNELLAKITSIAQPRDLNKYLRLMEDIINNRFNYDTSDYSRV